MSISHFETIHIEGGLLSLEYLHTISRIPVTAQSKEDYCTPAGLTVSEEIARAWKIAKGLRQKNYAGNEFPLEFLRQVLGFQDIAPYSADSEMPPTHTANGGEVPIIIAPNSDGLDKPQQFLSLQGRKITPFNLAQTHLNSSENSQWGIVCDGNNLRLLRDSTSITRSTYIDADLRRMLEEGEGHYSDFKVLYLIAHMSRFAPANDCPLERWRQESVQTGIRAHEKMRGGVTNAVLALGNGFLSHNEGLREKISRPGGMEAYYRELLWMAYRLIFLFVTEDRNALQVGSASKGQKNAYRHGYGVSRLRDRAVRPMMTDNYDDLWEGMKFAFSALQGIESICKHLGLPQLGGLFGTERCEMLEECRLRNGNLLTAIYALSWVRDEGKRRTRINYRDMGANELGSIYESLLELTPYCDAGGRFQFYELSAEENRGNARRTTGSYYTPPSLVEQLVKSTLQPALDKVDSEEELLAMRVLDPACGSGHFLLAATGSMADKLIRLRGGEGGANEAARRRHMRDIVEKCIYGVDKNGMALDLARMALWLETFDADRPLLLLDNHLQWGDALLGVRDLDVLNEGIPDAAYNPLTGDDEALCAQLKQTNRKERRNKTASLFAAAQQELASEVEKVDAMLEEDLAQVADKRSAYLQLAKRHTETGINVAADMYSAAFLMAKNADAHPPTSADMFTALAGDIMQDGAVTAAARTCARANLAFHWWLRYPNVQAKGGFDIILANPPWERIKLQEVEFFAHRAPEIAKAQNQYARRKLIDALHTAPEGTRERQLGEVFKRAKRKAEGSSNYMHNSGNFPLTGRGDVNTYALFAELCLKALNNSGSAGVIVPTGIATADTTKAYFSHLIENKRLRSLYDFENHDKLFPAVHSMFRFSLLSISASDSFDFVTFAYRTAHLLEKGRHVRLSADNLRLVNPNTGTLPLYRTQHDCDVCEKIYRAAAGVFWLEEGDINPWQARFQRMFDMSADSKVFATEAKAGTLNLYEGKYLHQYDHRWKTWEKGAVRELSAQEKQNPAYAVTTRYYVEKDVMQERLAGIADGARWLLLARAITNAVSERMLIISAIPSCAVGNNAITLHSQRSPCEKAFMLALLNSLVLDYAARQKISGVNLNYVHLKQIPLLSPDDITSDDMRVIIPIVLELTYTAYDIKPFYDDIMRDAPNYNLRLPERDAPFLWDEERRAGLRAQIDAYIALKYGLTYDELRYILDPKDLMGEDYPSETFRVVKEREQNIYGEYRTARLVLEEYDKLTSS